MTTFSISEAIGEPFRLIRERPLWILLWGMPYALVLAILLPVFAVTFAELPFGDSDTLTDAELQAQFGQMMSFQAVSLLLNLLQLAGGIAVWGAVNRAVLSGRAPDRWAHFRLSMDELWLLVVGILLFVGLYVGLIVVVILVAVVFGVAAFGSGGEPSLGWFFALFGVMGSTLLATMAVLARTSLIAPASVHLKRLALPEGWRLAKGQTVRLLGLLVLSWLIYMVLYVLVVGVVVAIVAVIVVTSGPMPAFATVTTFGDVIPSTTTLLLWAAIGFVPVSFIMGVLMVVYVAPFAHAFRQLWDRRPDAPAGLRDPLASGAPVQEPSA